MARDSRAAAQPLLQYIESHSDDVTDLSFHPSQPSCLLSGSTDGLVNLYDTSIGDEDDALVQVFNHGSSIAHAGFLSDHETFALSHDEIFSIYDFKNSSHDEDGDMTQHFGDLRPQLQCDYVVDLVSSKLTGPLLGVGSHSARDLDLVPLSRQTAWALGASSTIRLLGGHGGEVVRSMCLSPDDETIFTAGEDGLIKAWRTFGDESNATEIKASSPDKKRKKHRSINNDERARFKPY
ncbi:MAG: hypothetical protein Q9218_002954 [Villophora microphyllina]